jgi:hypothetical protein
VRGQRKLVLLLRRTGLLAAEVHPWPVVAFCRPRAAQQARPAA